MFHGVSESLGPPPPPPPGPPPGYEAEADDEEVVEVDDDEELPAPPGLPSSAASTSPSHGPSRKSNKMPYKRGAASTAERDSDQDQLEMDRVTWVQFNFRLSA